MTCPPIESIDIAEVLFAVAAAGTDEPSGGAGRYAIGGGARQATNRSPCRLRTVKQPNAVIPLFDAPFPRALVDEVRPTGDDQAVVACAGKHAGKAFGIRECGKLLPFDGGSRFGRRSSVGGEHDCSERHRCNRGAAHDLATITFHGDRPPFASELESAGGKGRGARPRRGGQHSPSTVPHCSAAMLVSIEGYGASLVRSRHESATASTGCRRPLSFRALLAASTPCANISERHKQPTLPRVSPSRWQAAAEIASLSVGKQRSVMASNGRSPAASVLARYRAWCDRRSSSDPA